MTFDSKRAGRTPTTAHDPAAVRRIFITLAPFWMVVWMVAGCATSKAPPPKTAKPDDGVAAALPPPKRDVPEAAKAAFQAAVQSYGQARSQGLDATRCAAVADEFADVYRSFPKAIEAKFNEGAVYQQCGDLAKAEAIYQELLTQHVSFGPALNNLGQIAMSRGQVGAGQAFFERAARAKDSHGYTNLAVLKRDAALRGDKSALKEAIDNIHRALAVDSFNIDAYGILASMVYDHARNKSELEIARLICVQAMKRFPEYAAVYNVLGLVLLRMDEVTRALAQFRQAVALDENFVEAHMNIGAITLSFRDYQSAERSFSQVLSLSPPAKVKRDATIGMGVACRGQRRYDEAMKHYERAQALAPDDASVAYNMGILLQDYMFDAGNPAKALEQLQKARQLLQRFADSVSRRNRKARDAHRRIKNIDEMMPILREQQQMMQQGQQG